MYQGALGNYVSLSETEVGRSTLDPYVMADANVNKALWKKRLRIGMGCKNITNVTNIGSSVVAGGVHSGGGGQMPMAIGRTWFLRLDIDLKKQE